MAQLALWLCIAWSVCLSVCLCICLLHTTMSPTETAEPIQMPFGLWTRVGQRNHLLRWGPDPPGEGTILGGHVS